MASYYHIKVKTVAEWRKRKTVKESLMGPRQPLSMSRTYYEIINGAFGELKL